MGRAALPAIHIPLPSRLGGPTSNPHDCRMGRAAQPAIHTIAELAGWHNKHSTQLPNGMDGPSSNS